MTTQIAITATKHLSLQHKANPSPPLAEHPAWTFGCVDGEGGGGCPADVSLGPPFLVAERHEETAVKRWKNSGKKTLASVHDAATSTPRRYGPYQIYGGENMCVGKRRELERERGVVSGREGGGGRVEVDRGLRFLCARAGCPCISEQRH